MKELLQVAMRKTDSSQTEDKINRCCCCCWECSHSHHCQDSTINSSNILL